MYFTFKTRDNRNSPILISVDLNNVIFANFHLDNDGNPIGASLVLKEKYEDLRATKIDPKTNKPLEIRKLQNNIELAVNDQQDVDRLYKIMN